jgi:hypothetical protein
MDLDTGCGIVDNWGNAGGRLTLRLPVREIVTVDETRSAE